MGCGKGASVRHTFRRFFPPTTAYSPTLSNSASSPVKTLSNLKNYLKRLTADPAFHVLTVGLLLAVAIAMLLTFFVSLSNPKGEVVIATNLYGEREPEIIMLILIIAAGFITLKQLTAKAEKIYRGCDVSG